MDWTRVTNVAAPSAGRPDLRYLMIRRKAHGYGHVVVYRVTDVSVEVLHVFHTAQDWQTRLTEETPEPRAED
jgi:plasmid stabilization system protein ParE